MRASVNVEYNQSFRLSEENLMKIDEFVRRRAVGIEDFSISYEVSRIDHALITYETPTEVASEENNLAEAAKSLKIAGDSDSFKVQIIFKSRRGVFIDIFSEDRDRALLLASDLKPYVQSEVLRSRLTRVLRTIDSRLFAPIVFASSIPLIMLYSWWVLPRPLHVNTTNMTDSQRLAYLVDLKQNTDALKSFPLIMTMPFGVLLAGLLLGPVLRAFVGEDTFYWGKEVRRSDRKASLRNQIFWVVIVGLLISVIGSFVFAELNRK